MPDDLFQMLKVYRWGIKEAQERLVTKLQEEDRNIYIGGSTEGELCLSAGGHECLTVFRYLE